jgi:hypothetical protein
MRKATPANNTTPHQQIPNHMLHHPRSAMRESSSQRGARPLTTRALQRLHSAIGKRLRLPAIFGFSAKTS